VFLSTEAAEDIFGTFGPMGQQKTWVAENWSPLVEEALGRGLLLKCANYDVENRTCLVYDRRPLVCSDYPNYNGVMDPDRLVCGYQAELGRTVLPIVGVT